MRHLFTLIFALLAAAGASADNAKETEWWKNPQVNDVNRLPRRANFFAFESEAKAQVWDKAKSERFLSLDGTWRFKFSENLEQRPENFFAVDYDDSSWTDFTLPGLLEFNGYGEKIYVNVGYAWRGKADPVPPMVYDKENYVGSFRRDFVLPGNWKDMDVNLHIGSATSNLQVWVNGQFVGYSEDSKMAAEFDITPYLKSGRNKIALQVMRWCDGTWFEDQDFWRFTGIARESYIYATPKCHIEDITIGQDLTNNYKDGVLNYNVAVKGEGTVDVVLKDENNKEVAALTNKAEGTMTVKNVKAWTAETPTLYNLYITLKQNGEVKEVVRQRVGFRNIKIENRQLLVNGQPVLIKGANRHEMDPDHGYVISMERMREDAEMMKDLNMNAVRTCHYPDDPRWYDLCDEMGLYVTAEANVECHGAIWHTVRPDLANKPEWKHTILGRNEANVKTLRNHPSIIVWSLGNESAGGSNFVAAYQMIKSMDQTRPVQYEAARKGDPTDIFCPMYYGYGGCIAYGQNGDKPLIQCEYAHAMGNSMGGMMKYWDIIRSTPSYQGGYIWDLIDQGLRDKSKLTGREIFTYGGDYGVNPPNDWNFNCNGVVAPDRSYNPHTYEVKYVYQNLWTKDLDAEAGTFKVYNEQFFAPIENCQLYVTLRSEGRNAKEVCVNIDKLMPQETKSIQSNALKDAVKQYIEQHKQEEITADFAYIVGEKELAHEQFIIHNSQFIIHNSAPAGKIRTAKSAFMVTEGAKSFSVNRETGLIDGLTVNGEQLIPEGATLKPDFWRAPTDNDYGAQLQRKMGVWRNPEMNLLSCVSKSKSIVSTFDMPKIGAKLTLTYQMLKGGDIKVTEAFEIPDTAKQPDMFRFGMRMTLKDNYDRISYYGRGPIENYIDRNLSQPIIESDEAVTDQYFNYIRPQESGNHSDVRRFCVYDSKANHGLEFMKVDAPFEASALPYTTEQLDGGDKKEGERPMHSGDLVPKGITDVHISARQYGLGCVNSWGAVPEPEYRLPSRSMTFSFIIKTH